eukprot:5353221-Prymnesium_polylepis.1
MDRGWFCGCRVAECPQGSMVADALRWSAGTDLALVNSGSLAANLSATNVTLADLNALTPEPQEVVVISMTGLQLREALTHSISQLGTAGVDGYFDGRFLQVSSTVWFDWQLEDGAPRAKEIMLGARPATPGGQVSGFVRYEEHVSYAVALPKYLIQGGHGHTALQAAYMASNVSTLPTLNFEVGLGFSVLEATSSYLDAAAPHGPLPAPSAGRIH